MVNLLETYVAAALLLGWLAWLWDVASERSHIKDCFYNSYRDCELFEFGLEKPGVSLFREIYEDIQWSAFTLNKKTKMQAGPGSLYGNEQLNSEELLRLFLLEHSLKPKNFVPTTQKDFSFFKNFSFLYLKFYNFLAIFDFSNISYLRFEFVGRKVLLVALTIYGYGIFFNWQKLEISQKQQKFETFFNYIFSFEIGWFVSNFLEIILTSKESLFSFNSVDFAISFRAFHACNKMVFEKHRPVTDYELNPTAALYQKITLLRLANLFLKVYNPLFWEQLDFRTKKAFLKTIVVITRQKGSYIYLFSLLEPINVMNNSSFNFSALSVSGLNEFNLLYKQILMATP